MDNGYDQLLTNYILGDSLPPAQVNSSALILNAQLHGALEGIGEGLISGGVVTAAAGLAVDVSALKAAVATVLLKIYIETLASTEVDELPASDTSYIHAGVLFPAIAGDPDSRETAVVDLFWDASDDVADAIVLYEVVTDGSGVTAVTDLRVWTTPQTALNLAEANVIDITAIEAAIGSDYFGGSPPASSLDTRVDALEGGGGGGATYWGAMEKELGDATTPGTEMDSKDAAAVAAHIAAEHQAGGAGDGETLEIPEVWDVDAVNQALHLLKITRSVDPDLPENQISAVTIVWGVWGDGTGSTPDAVDRVNSTWLPA